MKKYLAVLAVMLISIGFVGIVAAQPPLPPVTDPTPGTKCGPECYANSILQKDTQIIQDVESCPNSPIIFNEGIAAAVTKTPAYDATTNPYYIRAGFSKTEQTMYQNIQKLVNPGGLTANKALQAAWTENQGDKEFNPDGAEGYRWDYEAAYIRQNTVQQVWDINYGLWEPTNSIAIFNADSKLAVISDNLNAMTKDLSTTSSASSTESATGSLTNNANINANIRTAVNAMP